MFEIDYCMRTNNSPHLSIECGARMLDVDKFQMPWFSECFSRSCKSGFTKLVIVMDRIGSDM